MTLTATVTTMTTAVAVAATVIPATMTTLAVATTIATTPAATATLLPMPGGSGSSLTFGSSGFWIARHFNRVFRTDETERIAFRARTCSAAETVDIIFRRLRQVVVDHMLDMRDV